MTNLDKKVIRYSISFKLMVVKEVESGLLISEVSRKYGIKGGQTVHNWIKKFGKDHLLNKIVRIEMKGESDQIKQLQKELLATKVALADAVMVNKILEDLVGKANEIYDTDFKKNIGLGSLQIIKNPMV